MAGPFMSAILGYQSAIRDKQYEAESATRNELNQQQLLAARRENVRADRMAELQSNVDAAVKSGDSKAMYEATLAVEYARNPAQAYKLQQEVSEKDLDKAQARLMGIRMGVQANDPNAFKEWGELNGFVKNGYEVDAANSKFDSKTDQGVITIFNTQDPSDRKQIPINSGMLDAALVKTFRSPGHLLNFARINKEWSEAQIAKDKAGAGYGLLEAKAKQASIEKDEANAAESTAKGKLYSAQADTAAEELRLGKPKMEIDKLKAEINAAQARASHSYAAAAGLKDEREARALEKEYNTILKSMGAVNPKDLSKIHADRRKAMTSDILNPPTKEQLAEFDAQAADEVKQQEVLYPAALLAVDLRSANPKAGIKEVTDAAREYQSALAKVKEGMKKARQAGIKDDEDAETKLTKRMIESKKMVVEKGKRYLLIGNTRLALDK